MQTLLSFVSYVVMFRADMQETLPNLSKIWWLMLTDHKLQPLKSLSSTHPDLSAAVFEHQYFMRT